MFGGDKGSARESMTSPVARVGSGRFAEQEIGRFKTRLRLRAGQLKEEIRLGLLKYDENRFAVLADRVGDIEDQSVASLVGDLDLSEIDRDVDELRDVESALTRIAESRYGLCIDCQELISFERLDKLPSAARCHACQERFEARDRRPAYRKL